MELKLSPGAKLLVLLSFNVLALTFDKLNNLLALTASALLIYLLSRPSASRVKLTLLLILPPVWGVTLAQALFYQGWPRTVLLVVIPPDLPVLGWLTGGVYLYLQGFTYGLKQSLRLVSVFLVGLPIAWTTSESSLIKTLRGALRSAKLSVMVSVAVRFFRAVMDEAKAAYTAFTLSGFKLTRARDSLRLMIPLVAQVIRRSYTVTLSLLSKGFNPARSMDHGSPLKPSLDVSLALAFLAFSASLGLAKLLTVLFLLDAFYLPALKPIYAWVLDNL